MLARRAVDSVAVLCIEEVSEGRDRRELVEDGPNDCICTLLSIGHVHEGAELSPKHSDTRTGNGLHSTGVVNEIEKGREEGVLLSVRVTRPSRQRVTDRAEHLNDDNEEAVTSSVLVSGVESRSGISVLVQRDSSHGVGELSNDQRAEIRIHGLEVGLRLGVSRILRLGGSEVSVSHSLPSEVDRRSSRLRSRRPLLHRSSLFLCSLLLRSLAPELSELSFESLSNACYTFSAISSPKAEAR